MKRAGKGNTPDKKSPSPKKCKDDDKVSKQGMLGASKPEGSNPAVGYVFMFLLAVQYGFQPYLANKFSPPGTNKTLVVFAQEAVKALYICSVILATGKFHEFFSPSNLLKSVSSAAPPAAIYALQNWCTQLAYSQLDSVTFNCLNQTKLVSTAVCVYLMFGKKQSYMQVLALIVLIFAALLLQNGSPAPPPGVHLDATSTTGVAAILTASLLSGVAAALCQHALLTTGALELTLSMALVTFGLLTASLLVSPDGASLFQAEGLDNFAPSVAIPVCTNAAGGIFVSQVTKHLGGVTKGFSVVVGLVITGILQSYVTSTMLPYNVLIALVLVTFACSIHSLFQPVGKQKSF